jgi:hypothetical protein
MNAQGEKKKILILVLVVIGAVLFQLYEVDEPWFGQKDYNGAIYGILSRNFVKHGYLETRFGPAMNTGPVTDGRFTYYLHHPPLFYFLVSFSFHMFGVNEWSARLVPILFSILALFFFFRLVRKIWGLEEAYFSTLLLAFLPINLYFSRIVLQESSISLGIVMMLWFYVKWRENRRPAEYWKVVACFLLFGLIDWPAYYMLPLLTMHTVVVDRGRKSPGRARIILLPLFGILLFLLFMAYTTAITAYQEGGGLLNAFLFRSAVKTPLQDYSMLDFARREMIWGYHLFTPFVPLLSLIWIFRFLSRRDDLERNLYVVMLLLFGLIHILLFKDAAYIHEFWLYHLSVGIALSAGLGLTMISRSLPVTNRRALKGLVTVALPLCFFLFSTNETFVLHRTIENKNLSMAGMKIRERSRETDRVIIHWEDPVHPLIGEYFRYYGFPVHNKPIPNVAYYSDRNIRWGLKDLHDFESLVRRENGEYRFFLTRVDYLRDGMDGEIRAFLLENYVPVFAVDNRGKDIDDVTIESLLQGEKIGGKRWIIVFEKKAGEIERDESRLRGQ